MAPKLCQSCWRQESWTAVRMTYLCCTNEPTGTLMPCLYRLELELEHRGSRNARSQRWASVYFLVWGRGQVHTRGRHATARRADIRVHGCRACERSAFSETLVRTKRAKEIERSDAKRFGEGRMLVATRELRRPILSLRAPPKRLQAALCFLARRLGRRLRLCLWLLVFFPPSPLLRRLALLGCHCLGIA